MSPVQARPFSRRRFLGGVTLVGTAGLLGLHPKLVVLGVHEPRTEAELEATLGQEIDRRRFPCDQDRVAEIIVEDIGADAEMGRGCGRTHQRRQRREEIGQVIGHAQHRIAQRFELARFVHPGGPGGRLPDVHTETEWLHDTVPS
jgi:hypothetical protein